MKFFSIVLILFLYTSCSAQKPCIDFSDAYFFEIEGSKLLEKIRIEDHSNAARKMYVIRETTGKYIILSTPGMEATVLKGEKGKKIVHDRIISLNELNDKGLSESLLVKYKLDSPNLRYYMVQKGKDGYRLFPLKIFFEGLYEM